MNRSWFRPQGVPVGSKVAVLHVFRGEIHGPDMDNLSTITAHHVNVRLTSAVAEDALHVSRHAIRKWPHLNRGVAADSAVPRIELDEVERQVLLLGKTQGRLQRLWLLTVGVKKAARGWRGGERIQPLCPESHAHPNEVQGRRVGMESWPQNQDGTVPPLWEWPFNFPSCPPPPPPCPADAPSGEWRGVLNRRKRRHVVEFGVQRPLRVGSWRPCSRVWRKASREM